MGDGQWVMGNLQSAIGISRSKSVAVAENCQLSTFSLRRAFNSHSPHFSHSPTFLTFPHIPHIPPHSPHFPMYIAIEGNIGAGKTTLANILAKRMGARLVQERFADNAFLPRFYADPVRYAFPLELSFLTERYEQLKAFLPVHEPGQQSVITDYLIIKSRLFAKMNLDDTEFDLFTRIFEVMNPQVRQPDILIYLHAPIETLQRHIYTRGRSYEQGIKNSYLERISKMYEDYLENLTIPVVWIDTLLVNFENDDNHVNTLLGLLSGGLKPARYCLKTQ
jgi:deoxyadenosine/deoxycytidine kinase